MVLFLDGGIIVGFEKNYHYINTHIQGIESGLFPLYR
jgi:hypothetical protein